MEYFNTNEKREREGEKHILKNIHLITWKERKKERKNERKKERKKDRLNEKRNIFARSRPHSFTLSGIDVIKWYLNVESTICQTEFFNMIYLIIYR